MTRPPEGCRNWGKEDFASYDSIYSENYAGTDGSLPFGTATLIKRETKWETVSLTEEEAKIKARTEAESALDAAIPDDAQILRTSASFVERDGKRITQHPQRSWSRSVSASHRKTTLTGTQKHATIYLLLYKHLKLHMDLFFIYIMFYS